MPIYRFNITEINYGTIEIEANSLEEAEEKVDKAYDNGCTLWNDSEYDFDFDNSDYDFPIEEK